jgi:hypothetical protein
MTRPVQQLLQRWQALQVDVRCVRHAGKPQRIQHYVLGGAKLARLGVFDEVGVLRHMARTLLHTARDPALPTLWCSAAWSSSQTRCANCGACSGLGALWRRQPSRTPYGAAVTLVSLRRAEGGRAFEAV